MYELEELNNGTSREEKGTRGEGKKFATLSLPLFQAKPVEDANGVVLPRGITNSTSGAWSSTTRPASAATPA